MSSGSPPLRARGSLSAETSDSAPGKLHIQMRVGDLKGTKIVINPISDRRLQASRDDSGKTDVAPGPRTPCGNFIYQTNPKSMPVRSRPQRTKEVTELKVGGQTNPPRRKSNVAMGLGLALPCAAYGWCARVWFAGRINEGNLWATIARVAWASTYVLGVPVLSRGLQATDRCRRQPAEGPDPEGPGSRASKGWIWQHVKQERKCCCP